MKEKLKRFFTEYSREKILALLLTFVLWIFMISGNSEIRDFSLKLEVIVDENVILVSDVADIVHVKASGSIFDFAGINEDRLLLRVNLSGKTAGIHTRFLDASMMPFDEGVKIEKIFPSELVFRISPKAEKAVSIDPWLEGQLPLGWKLSGWTVEPEKIVVEGPEREVEELENITTERILLGEITGNVERTVKVRSAVPFIKPAGQDIVKIKITVERDVETRNFPKINVKLDSGKESEIVPSEVSLRLRGPKDILHKMETEGFNVFVKDIEERETFKATSFYIKDLPEEVQMIEDKKPVEITINKVSK